MEARGGDARGGDAKGGEKDSLAPWSTRVSPGLTCFDLAYMQIIFSGDLAWQSAVQGKSARQSAVQFCRSNSARQAAMWIMLMLLKIGTPTLSDDFRLPQAAVLGLMFCRASKGLHASGMFFFMLTALSSCCRRNRSIHRHGAICFSCISFLVCCRLGKLLGQPSGDLAWRFAVLIW